MSAPDRPRGVRVLKAVSSSIRLHILNLLFDRGPLSYTELMSSLKMNPSREAGRFAYHLKYLLKVNLIEADAERKKYGLTDLGQMVIEVADKVEKKTLKPKGMLVRASRLALEEFDSNKIASSLIKEGKMPAELAQKVTKEAEKRLLKSRTKYLTAPLVREVVNTVLIEKGLEEYRHKLARLGLPVHEVTMLIEGKTKAYQRPFLVREAAGDAVLSEYMLLKVLPRDIADAHLSGSLHANDLATWTLKPIEIVHDLRFFYKNGMTLKETSRYRTSCPPPQNIESALFITFDALLHSTKETSETQVLDYFNVFLAPFAKEADPTKLKEALRSFISGMGQHADVSLGLELAAPDFIANKTAVGPSGKPVGRLKDFKEETQLLASLVLDVLAEECTIRPIFNPKIIVKIRPETSQDERAKALLLKAHKLAAERGTVHFASLQEKNQGQIVFSGSGRRYSPDLNGDWEIDTLRTACLGIMTVNLPRITYECEENKTRFFEILNERLDMACRALEIKYGALRRRGEDLLPFLAQSANGDQYLKLEDSSLLINPIGLKEASEAFYGKSISQDEKTLELAKEIAQYISDFTRRAGRKHRKRLLQAAVPNPEASERLAQLDVDRYGLGKVRFSGTRERPFYSTVSRLTVRDNQFSLEFPSVGQKMSDTYAGGSLTLVELGETEYKPDALLSLTSRIINDCNVEFFSYDRKMTCCLNCKNSWFGLAHRCPSCGAVSTLSTYDRYVSS